MVVVDHLTGVPKASKPARKISISTMACKLEPSLFKVVQYKDNLPAIFEI